MPWTDTDGNDHVFYETLHGWAVAQAEHQYLPVCSTQRALDDL